MVFLAIWTGTGQGSATVVAWVDRYCIVLASFWRWSVSRTSRRERGRNQLSVMAASGGLAVSSQ